MHPDDERPDDHDDPTLALLKHLIGDVDRLANRVEDLATAQGATAEQVAGLRGDVAALRRDVASAVSTAKIGRALRDGLSRAGALLLRAGAAAAAALGIVNLAKALHLIS